MNKFLQKLAKLFLGISMAAGVGVAVFAGRKDASPAHAGDQASNSNWHEVTALNQLNATDSFTIATNNGSNFFNGSVTKGHFQTTAFSATAPTSTAAGVVKLENVSGNTWKIKIVSTSKYVTATATKSGSGSVSSSSDSYGWTFSYSSGFDAIYQESGKNAYLRSYDNNSFRTYANQSGAKFKMYRYEAQAKYTVSFAVNSAGYGTVSPSSIANVPSGTSISTSNNTITINGTTVTATPTANTAQYTYAFTGWSNNTGQVTAARTITANFSRTTNTFTVGGTISNGSLSDTSNIEYDGDLALQIVPNSTYTYPAEITVMMGTTDITSSVLYDSSDGSILYEGVTGNISITATCPSAGARYGITATATNGTCSGATEIVVGYTASITFQANDHYKLPSDSSAFTVNHAEINDYNSSTGVLILENPNGAVTVSVSMVAKEKYDVTLNLLNISKSSGPSGTNAVEEDEDVTIVFAANTNYGLPSTIIVEMGGDTLVVNEDYEWTQSTGTFYMPLLTDDLTITVSGVQRDLTNDSLTLGTKKITYTIGDNFELPSTVTATFNIAPTEVDVKSDVVVSGPVENGVVTGSGTITLTYTYSVTEKTQTNSYAITANAAVPADGSITKVTDASTLSLNDQIVVVNETASVVMTTAVPTSGTLGTASVTILNSKITSELPATAAILTLSGGNSSSGWQLTNGDNYLYVDNSNSRGTSLRSTSATNVITISSGDATIKASSTATGYLQYNAGSPRFSNYTSNQSKVQIYKVIPEVVKTLKWITAEVKTGSYYQGNSVTASDFTVTAHFNTGDEETVSSNITVTDGYLANIGSNSVTLTYGGKSCVVTVNATQAPVTSVSLNKISDSIGLDESYYLSDLTVTVTPANADQNVSWTLYNAGGLVETTDYTFDGDEYHSISEGVVVFRCISDSDNTKYAEFTLTIVGTPSASFAKDSTSGYEGKSETVSFVYSNIESSSIAIVSGNTSYVTIGTISASDGNGSVVINFVGAGSTSITISDGNSTFDTLTVTVSADGVSSVTWSASDIDVYTGATLSTTGWNVQYEMYSGDSGTASSYTIKIGSKTVTAGYTFAADDDGKTMHVEYGGESSSSVNVKVTQTIHSVIAQIPGTPTSSYQLVQSDDDLEEGRYLIVSQSDSVAFDGSLDTLDAAHNNFSVSISDGVIANNSSVAGKYFDLAYDAETGWTITSASGGNVGHDGSKNGLNGNGANTISISEGEATITGESDRVLQFNATNDDNNDRFRYYASGQHAISLFKLVEQPGTPVSTEIANVVTHKEAQRVAVKFAKAFNAAMDLTENCTTGLDDAWATCASAYSTFQTEAAALGSEKTYAEYYIKYASCEWSDNSGEACIERMLRTYKACVQVHRKTAFMSDLITLSAPHVSPLVNIIGENTNTVAIIVIISMVSVTAIGGYFFLRKRRENI